MSATDKSKLFKVNLNDKTYSETVTDQLIPGLNGLFCDKKTSRIYVNGFGTDNKPNDVVGFVTKEDTCPSIKTGTAPKQKRDNLFGL